MMISYNSYTQSLSISNHTKSNNASITYAKIVNKEKLYAFVVKTQYVAMILNIVN